MITVASVVLCGNLLGQQPASQVDRELIRTTVENLATIVQREYFDPDVAANVSTSLRGWLAEGRYAGTPTLQSLADMLTRDLFAMTSDQHLAVAVVQEKGPTGTLVEPAVSSRQVRGQRENFGTQRVEILAGNVGYLNLTAMYRPEEARETLSAAMRTLRYADALILDLRSNSGGSPGTAALLASYFFDTPELPLFEIINRSGEVRSYATEKMPLPERNESRPLYVLTSARTFSAGEGLAFILQERHRAKIIGETTAGAANPGRPYAVNSQFEVVVPNGKVVTAVTGRNWEGSGVEPDVPVSASDALCIAHASALSQLVSQSSAGPRRDAIKRLLEAVEASKPGRSE
jgi:C-terminal processing protease CtpA/Prc